MCLSRAIVGASSETQQPYADSRTQICAYSSFSNPASKLKTLKQSHNTVTRKHVDYGRALKKMPFTRE
jgi:hypothetical protein